MDKKERYRSLVQRIDQYKPLWDKNGVIQFKNERIAILQRNWGRQVGNPIFIGLRGTKIPRYILLVFIAKSTPTFRTLGRQIDGLNYFTLYALGQVAGAFKSLRPWLTAVHYDRTKVAKKVYEMVAEDGYVEIKKLAGDTLITTTPKGDKFCEELLPDLISLATLSQMSPAISGPENASDIFRAKKGISPQFINENANVRMVAEKLLENISKISFDFREELKDIEDEPLDAKFEAKG
jgi:hypothetical protein